MSPDPKASLIDSRQLVLFLIVPVVVRLAPGARAMTTLDVIMALGAAGAFVGVVEYTIFGFDNLDRRPMGSLSHYMTYSGLIMLVLAAAVARLLFYPAQRIWPAVAVPALAVALAATQTRNAYLGALAAIACLLPLRQVRLLLAVPVLIVLFVVAAPAQIKDRAFSIANLQDDSNRDRLQMLVMGRNMIRDHPMFGVGPEMVGRVYRPISSTEPRPHLQPAPAQCARADRGRARLAGPRRVAVFHRDGRMGAASEFRRGPAPALAAAGLGAIVAMLTAGLFEYNFGDSEFMMLFLALISLPYAARSGSPASRGGSDRSR